LSIAPKYESNPPRHTSCGRFPDNLLEPICRKDKCVRLFISGGTGPERLFFPRESADKFLKLPRDAGIAPVR
jgi:hypothetical protein